MHDFPWWTDSQRALMDDSQKLADEVLIPIAEKCIYKKAFPWEAVKEIAAAGWFGATIPEEYGGHQREWGVTGACILSEQAGRAGALAAAYVTSIIGATQQILHDGSEAQKEKWLPKLAKGELLGSISMTEPYAGSDIASLETSAVHEGEFYVVNGIKRFQTSAAAADLYMTYVKTSSDSHDRKSYRHLTGIIIEKGTPGFSVERINEWMGSEGMYNCYLRFDNARVPTENVIGGEGNGWQVMMRGLNIERVLSAAVPLGGMREAMRYARQHLERRVQFGQTTGSISVNQFKLADMYSKFQLARLLIYYTAYCADLGRDVPIEAALSKLFSSEAGLEVALEAVQCMGGNGVMKIYPVERIMREMKLNQIAAGTSEILRLLIYRMGTAFFANILKMPHRIIDEEVKRPLPIGNTSKSRLVSNETDILKLLAENYRVNPGLHMTLGDIKQVVDINDEDLLSYLDVLENKGLAQQWQNRKSQVELVKATLTGIKEANPPEYYRYIPDWVPEKDIF
ncbi:MAG: acyl-CoA/acyl-ACP dehydrogenase [Deltaproteobacteria bacterium]|nr:acyl-CoA/acyl-ACP dehydrogenase [Deltaproteobacteria bacterium]